MTTPTPEREYQEKILAYELQKLLEKAIFSYVYEGASKIGIAAVVSEVRQWHNNKIATAKASGKAEGARKELERFSGLLLNDLKDSNTMDSHRLQGRIIQYVDGRLKELENL